MKWKWGTEEQAAFDGAKTTLQKSNLLVHYDPSRELILECDESPEGLGAVLSHCVNGIDRPIAFQSGSLTKAEKNY